jgi:hypothetical protein
VRQVQFSSIVLLNSFSAAQSVPGLVSNFSLTDTFSTLPRASSLVSRFRALGLVLGGTDSAGSIFQVSRYQTHFRRYRWHWVQFSSFALSDTFSTLPRVPSLIFNVHANRLIFSSTNSVGSSFQLSCSQTHF